MNRFLSQHYPRSLLDEPKTMRRLELALQKNRAQDNSPELDRLSQEFSYENCRELNWNPERFSLFYGTPLWAESSPSQRVKLNQLYWVAYYCQIISAEIATIFFNQTAGAGLYGIEDFRIVCDTLDLESMQERAHIAAFKKVAEDFELAEFGERIFTYPMRSPYVETMIFQNSNRVRAFWKAIQLRAFTLLSSGNAFIGSQYFTVRGLRTLNGKIVQHQLSQFYLKHPQRDSAPIPSVISYHHFLDESFHFNTSMVVGSEAYRALNPPTKFEKSVVNRMIAGCQRDHFNFSTAINGIFWHDPATYAATYKILRSRIFGMDHGGALQMMERVFGQESEGMHLSQKTHQTALVSYREYVSSLTHLDATNRDMKIMAGNSLERHLRVNRRALRTFRAPMLHAAAGAAREIAAVSEPA